MATNNSANQLRLQDGMLPVSNYADPAATAPAEGSSVYDNSHQAPSLSRHLSTNVIPHDDTRPWVNFATCTDKTELFQNGGNAAQIGMGVGDEVAFTTVHEQFRDHPCITLLDNIQHVHPDVELNWSSEESHHPYRWGFLPSQADDPRLLSQQNVYTAAISVTPDLFMGLPTVDQLGSVEATILGPQYQELDHTEYMKDVGMVDGFNPSLYYQVGSLLSQPFDPNNMMRQIPVTLTNEAYGTTAEAQRSLVPSNLILQSTSTDIWSGTSNDWTSLQLPQNSAGAFSEAPKRPALYDDPRPSKRPRTEAIRQSMYPNTDFYQLGHLAPKDFSKSIKRSHAEVGPLQDLCARKKRIRNVAQVECNHDIIPQTFGKALVEVFYPKSLKKHSRLLSPGNLAQAVDSGDFRVFQLKALQPLAPEIKSTTAKASIQSRENSCLQCKIRKKQCIPPNGRSHFQSACTRCLSIAGKNGSVAKSLCVRPEDLDVKPVDPDVYFDSYLAITRKLLTSSSTDVQCRIAIHMTYLIEEHPHLPSLWKSSALICNVEELIVYALDEVAYDMFHYLAINDLRYTQVLRLHSRRMPSVKIPEGQVPKLPTLIRWATSTLALAPNGVVSELQGSLYQFALLYIEKEHYPLRRVLELALKYTAIYNVCVGQMSLQLSPASPFLYKIPPKLRVQICGPLISHYKKLGEELQESMLKIMYNKNGPDKKEYLPLCIIWWLLMTVHQHKLNDTDRLQFSCYFADPIDAEYIEARREMLSNIVRTHQATYHALFRRDRKSICPIFNNGLVNLCGIGSEEKELLEKLQSLRITIRQYKEDATARGAHGRAQDEFENLTDLFDAIDLASDRQASSSVCSGLPTISANISDDVPHSSKRYKGDRYADSITSTYVELPSGPSPAKVLDNDSQSSKRRKGARYADSTSSKRIKTPPGPLPAKASDDNSQSSKRRNGDRYADPTSSERVKPPSRPPAAAVSSGEFQANNVTEELDDVDSISSTCSESSRISGFGAGRSLAERRAKAMEVAKLREYWLARCMLVYDNQEWLFEGRRR